jgi:hypothetical protein
VPAHLRLYSLMVGAWRAMFSFTGDDPLDALDQVERWSPSFAKYT